MRSFGLPVLLLSIIFACGGGGREPYDGGRPLEFATDLETAEILAQQYGARREKGGWHRSVGHEEPMSPPQTISGVWVTGFEENSFYPGETAIPHPADLRRFSHEIEVDERQVHRLANRTPTEPDEAYLLKFVGRRMRDPYMVDCSGVPQFVTVVDRLVSARHLGAMKPISSSEFRAALLARPTRVRRIHDGNWGEQEAEAVKRCAD